MSFAAILAASLRSGYLICSSLPTKAMLPEIQAAGKCKYLLLNREDDRLQVIILAELFDRRDRSGVLLDLHMARTDAVKSAVTRGDEDKQRTLIQQGLFQARASV